MLGLTIYQNKIFVGGNLPNNLYVINLSNVSDILTIPVGEIPTSVSVFNNIIYIAFGFNSGKIASYDLLGNLINSNFYNPSFGGKCLGLTVDKNILYTSIIEFNAIDKIVLPLPPSPNIISGDDLNIFYSKKDRKKTSRRIKKYIDKL